MSLFPSNSPFNQINEVVPESQPQKIEQKTAGGNRELETIYQDLSDLYAQMEHNLGRYNTFTSRLADIRDDVYRLLP